MSDVGDPIADEAWRREASHHEGHRNFRPHLRPKGANLMGLRGEKAFADRLGLQVDLSPRLGGDGNVDLRLKLRVERKIEFVVDCKAALVPKDLIVEADVCKPETIYVLCRYWEDTDSCTLIGWQWGSVLMKSEPKDYGYGIINYWCPAGLLRDISELEARVAG
jgi:hypothetical protein